MRKIFSLLFVFIIVITMCAVVRVDAESPINPHIKAIYEYNENGTGTGADFTGCLGGSEAGCTDIISTKNGSSEYAVGTVIKYEVKDGEERYFNVIHDDGTTLTLQERQNTVSNVAWNRNNPDEQPDNGPLLEPGYALYELENVANDWSYVNTQNYSIDGLERNAKARMITVQELEALNCTTIENSCMRFVNNYLSGATNYGGSFDTDSGSGVYWTMTSYDETRAYHVLYAGSVEGGDSGYNSTQFNARAVVVIDKAGAEVTPPTPSESDATPEQGETINTEDTLKMSYLGYILGVFVIFAGAYVIYLGIEKKYDNEEE